MSWHLHSNTANWRACCRHSAAWVSLIPAACVTAVRALRCLTAIGSSPLKKCISGCVRMTSRSICSSISASCYIACQLVSVVCSATSVVRHNRGRPEVGLTLKYSFHRLFWSVFSGWSPSASSWLCAHDSACSITPAPGRALRIDVWRLHMLPASCSVTSRRSGAWSESLSVSTFTIRSCRHTTKDLNCYASAHWKACVSQSL